MPEITPFLWFDHQAEEAANFYVSVFPNSEVRSVARTGAAGPGEEGTVLTVEFALDGTEFTALNGGPDNYAFNESVSFVVHCETQDEVDHYWDALCAGGAEIACGWLKDRYGLRWQIVPVQLPMLLGDPDPGRAQRAMEAMLKMTKLDIGVLQAAADAG